MVLKKAYAKVNLGLDITGRRDDGYHMVRMIMQSLNIYDELTFEMSDDPEINISPAVENDNNLSLGKDNLIYKAAERISQIAGYKGGINITLKKNIPIAAGMAGGSSDCAATLKGVNELLDAGLTEEQLRDIGVKLGADVPYCIMGGTALSEGIGEILTPLPPLPTCIFVVAKPAVSVSTAEAYGGYDRLAEERPDLVHPDIDGQVEALKNGDLKGLTDRFLNVLEYVTAEKYSEIRELEEMMRNAGALNAMMSGSGPTVFGIFDSEEKALKAVSMIDSSGLAKQLFRTECVNISG